MSQVLRFDGAPASAFQRVDTVEDLPADGTAIEVDLSIWEVRADVLVAWSGPVAIRLANTANIAELDRRIFEGCDTVKLEFPNFADGRAYSQAHVIREQIRFSGDLRASGQASVSDQFIELWRTGFSSVELRDDQKIEDASAALGQFSAYYQPSRITRRTIRELRRSRASS